MKVPIASQSVNYWRVLIMQQQTIVAMDHWVSVFELPDESQAKIGEFSTYWKVITNYSELLKVFLWLLGRLHPFKLKYMRSRIECPEFRYDIWSRNSQYQSISTKRTSRNWRGTNYCRTSTLSHFQTKEKVLQL